jgi:lipopolysaccharide transport system ATP-binding protein
MGDIAIKFENISKQYRLGEIGTGTLSHDLNRWWHKVRGLEDPYLKIGADNTNKKKTGSEYIWALEDINLEVKQGEVLGIIGRNGAGKSTLLKILSKVTRPTTGIIRTKGRIASLLEVGTGFHPEMTGRENVFMNGSIMGMTRSEIYQRFDEIISFAGVEQFIDTPVKRYSSGMIVRLGFAVAAHLEPEILVVDEVLAVGDAEFQKKALGKVQQISHGHGRTVLFVSHNMSTIRNLCEKGILLSSGKLQYSGSAGDAVNLYEKIFLKETEAYWINKEKKTFLARLDRIELKDIAGNLRNEFLNSDEIHVHFFIRSFEKIKNVKVGFDLLRDGVVVFRSQQVDSDNLSELQANTKYEFICQIPGWFLNYGEYQIRPLFSIHCAESLTSVFDVIISFNIIINPEKSEYHQVLNKQNHPGVVFPIMHWMNNNTLK